MIGVLCSRLCTWWTIEDNEPPIEGNEPKLYIYSTTGLIQYYFVSLITNKCDTISRKCVDNIDSD